MRHITLLLILGFQYSTGFTQSVGIGATNPDNSAKLDISSTTQGLLIPRVTTSQRNAISLPASGLLVYDLDKQTIYYYDGENWVPFLFATDPMYIPSKKIYYYGDNWGFSEFGESASLRGDYAIIGAPGYEPTNAPAATDNYGKVVIYYRNNGSWGQQQEITNPASSDEERFGTSVAINDTWAVVGVPNNNVGANADEGSVYIYKRNGTNWTLFQEITGNNAANNDHFGFSVSIDNNIIVVGAPDDDINIGGNSITNQGSVYVFEYNGTTWVQRAKLYDTVATLESRLGFSVDVETNTSGGWYIIAGAPYKDIGANAQQGSAYLWGSFASATVWTLVNEFFHNSGSASDDNFGYAVACDDENYVVGAPGFGSSGRTYYYEFDGTWNEHLVTSINGTGTSVDVSNGKIMASQPMSSTNGLTNNGQSLIYYGNGSNGLFKNIIDVDPQSNAQYGYKVCISGNIALSINIFGHLQFTHWQD